MIGNPILRAAVIDTGIDPAHPDVAPVAGGVHFFMGAAGVEHDEAWTDESGHGTACAGLVSRGLTRRIELLSVRVTGGDQGGSPRVLAAAIGWAVEQGARVINVSLGAEAWPDETAGRVEAACRAAVARGAILVAAAGPEGKAPLPAILPDVIAVGTAFCPTDVFYAADEGYVELMARGDLQRVAWLGGASVLAQGTSFAAAHVSRAVCKILLADPALDLPGVRRALGALCVQGDAGFRRRWEQTFETFFRRRTPAHAGFIQRAALYPFNKEIHALVRFRDLAPFSITAVADPPGNRQCGHDAAEALGADPAGLVIRPDLDGALAEADTLVLGHTEAVAAVRASSQLGALVRRAVEQGKHVFSLSRVDPREHADLFRLAADKGVSIADPTVTRSEVAEVLQTVAANPVDPRKVGGRRFGDGRLVSHAGAFVRTAAAVLRHDCPVLGVFGTSRAQGKFTVQLALRRALGAMGYRVAQLATEPTGALLGASATLPMGYERGEVFGLDTYAQLTRLLLTAVKNREKPDVLLVGGQSGVVTFNRALDHLGLGSMGALAFGAAAQPDACILVCNVFDPPAHVRRCVGAIESVLDCKVLALALNDQVFEDHVWRGTARKRRAHLAEPDLARAAEGRAHEIGLPCHPALGEGPARLAEIAVEFFASAGPRDDRAFSS